MSIEREDWAQEVAAASPELDPDEQRMAVVTYRLLARGEPLSPAQIAEVSGISQAKAEERLRSWPLVLWDAQDRVAGFFGLHVGHIQPAHSIEVDDTTVFGWCAWDTLFITEILQRETHVESIDPYNGRAIRLTVTPDGVIDLDPPETVVSLLAPDSDLAPDAIQRFCHRIHFFSSPGSARDWIAGRPGMFSVTVDEAFELGRRFNRLRLGGALDHDGRGATST